MKAKKFALKINMNLRGTRTPAPAVFRVCDKAVSLFISNAARNGWISTKKDCILQASIFLSERNAHAN